jgi:hypothetical protein
LGHSSQDNIQDEETLVGQLSIRGVRHLRVRTEHSVEATLSDETLIAALASHPEPRLREALIALFLLHPEYAPIVGRLSTSRTPPADLVLRHLYTASVYLQRLWRGTLGLYMGHFQLLPDYFGRLYFGLPEPQEDFGEAGLRALAERFNAETGEDWLSVYEGVMHLVLEQLRLEAEAKEALPAMNLA